MWLININSNTLTLTHSYSHFHSGSLLSFTPAASHYNFPPPTPHREMTRAGEDIVEDDYKILPENEISISVEIIPRWIQVSSRKKIEKFWHSRLPAKVIGKSEPRASTPRRVSAFSGNFCWRSARLIFFCFLLSLVVYHPLNLYAILIV